MRDVPPHAAGDADPGPADRAARTGCATSTPATSTTPRAAAPRCPGCGDGRRRARLVRHRPLPAHRRRALPSLRHRRCPAATTARSADGAPGGCRCRSPGPAADRCAVRRGRGGGPVLPGRPAGARRPGRPGSCGDVRADAAPARPVAARRAARRLRVLRRRSPPAAYAHLARVARRRSTRVVLLGPAHFVPLRGHGGARRGRLRHPARPGRDRRRAADAARRDAGRRGRRPPAPPASTPSRCSCRSSSARWARRQGAAGGWSAGPRPRTSPRSWPRAAAGGTVAVVSTDLSHYLDLATARERDARTAAAILARDAAAIRPEDACGHWALRGLLQHAAERRDWTSSCCAWAPRPTPGPAPAASSATGPSSFMAGAADPE